MKSAALLLIALLAGCASATPDAAAAAVEKKPMNVRVLQQGAYAASSNTKPTILVARDAVTYGRLWDVVIGNGKAPAADFAKESVVFLIDQQRNTGGYSVEPSTVSIEGNSAAVKAAIKRPGRDHMVTQVLTVPYAVVAVPKVNLSAAKWIDAEGNVIAEEHGRPADEKKK